jgi:hypothetical protein
MLGQNQNRKESCGALRRNSLFGFHGLAYLAIAIYLLQEKNRIFYI